MPKNQVLRLIPQLKGDDLLEAAQALNAAADTERCRRRGVCNTKAVQESVERHKGRPFYRVLAGFGLIVASIRRVDDEFDFDTREHSAVVEVPTADRTIRVLAERHHFVKDTVLNKNWDLSAFDDRAAGNGAGAGQGVASKFTLTAFNNGCDTEYPSETAHARGCDPEYLSGLLRDALRGLRSVQVDTHDEDLMSGLQHAFACALFAALGDYDVNNILDDWEVDNTCLP